MGSTSLFKQFSITQAPSDLEVELFELLSEALRKTDERLYLSKLECETNKKIYKAFYDRAQVLLADPHFIEYMELDKNAIVLKTKILLEEIKSLKGTSGGHRKILLGRIPFVRFLLDQAGLGPHRQVEFLIELFQAFNVPELCGEKSAVKTKIEKWFKATKHDYDSFLSDSPL